MKTKTVTYLSIMLIGFLLSKTLPFFEVLGVTPWLLFCALFIPCFGYWKMLFIYYVPMTFNLLWSWTGLVSLAQGMLNIARALMNDPLFSLSPNQFTYLMLAIAYVQDAILLLVTYVVMKKAGIFSRITF